MCGLWNTCKYPLTGILISLLSAYFLLSFSAVLPRTVTLYYEGHTALIQFNTKGVPIITATTFKAFLYAVGYSHAHYRLWDMSIKRSMASGRMSEIFGQQTLEMDKFFRIYNFEKASEESVRYLPSDVETDYKSFADGINDCAKGLILLPIEFLITRSRFSDWRIADILMMIKYGTYSLNMSKFINRYVFCHQGYFI